MLLGSFASLLKSIVAISRFIFSAVLSNKFLGTPSGLKPTNNSSS
jgi:hypothetical protein